MFTWGGSSGRIPKPVAVHQSGVPGCRGEKTSRLDVRTPDHAKAENEGERVTASSVLCNHTSCNLINITCMASGRFENLPKRACPTELYIADLGWVGWGHQWWVSLHMFASATKTKQFDLNLRMFTKPFQFLRCFSFSEHVRCGFTRAVSSQLGWEFSVM